jgi:hypothetical protein
VVSITAAALQLSDAVSGVAPLLLLLLLLLQQAMSC